MKISALPLFCGSSDHYLCDLFIYLLVRQEHSSLINSKTVVNEPDLVPGQFVKKKQYI